MRRAFSAFFLIAASAAAAHAQDQTVTYTTSSQGISGGGRSACVQNDYYLNPQFQAISFQFTDSTGAEAGQVRVQVNFRWGYYDRPAMTLAVAINDVLQPEALVTPTSQPNSCGQQEVTSSVHEAAVTSWNPQGVNRVTVQFPADNAGGGGIAVLAGNGPDMLEIVVTNTNQAPNAPSGLLQLGVDGKAIGVGGATAYNGVQVRATVSDPDGDPVFIEVEIQPTSVFFTGTPNAASLPVSSGQTATASLLGLANGSYHWQARTVDSSGERSAWVSHGTNSEIAADFRIDTSPGVTVQAADNVNHAGGDCS